MRAAAKRRSQAEWRCGVGPRRGVYGALAGRLTAETAAVSIVDDVVQKETAIYRHVPSFVVSSLKLVGVASGFPKRRVSVCGQRSGLRKRFALRLMCWMGGRAGNARRVSDPSELLAREGRPPDVQVASTRLCLCTRTTSVLHGKVLPPSGPSRRRRRVGAILGLVGGQRKLRFLRVQSVVEFRVSSTRALRIASRVG